jgi:hypothetical protein
VTTSNILNYEKRNSKCNYVLFIIISCDKNELYQEIKLSVVNVSKRESNIFDYVKSFRIENETSKGNNILIFPS